LTLSEVKSHPWVTEEALPTQDEIALEFSQRLESVRKAQEKEINSFQAEEA
jgi:hypothetical protein